MSNRKQKNAEYMRKYRAERKNNPEFMENQRNNLRRFREKNPGYQSNWFNELPDKTERRARYNKNYSTKHPDKGISRRKAQRNVPLASKCEWCGSTEGLERHHEDYSKQLEVITLCKTCHTKAHQRLFYRALLALYLPSD